MKIQDWNNCNLNHYLKLHITRNLKREEMLDYIEMKFEVCKYLQEVERNWTYHT